MARKSLSVDWSAIKTLYVSGITLHELASRFSVNLNTLKARSAREKWSVPPERFSATIATGTLLPTEKTTQILHDIWAERASNIREKEYRISEKILNYSEQMSEDQALAKSQAIETFAKMGRRSTGLDREESNKNAINIAVLGEVGINSSESSFYKVAKNEDEGPRVLEIDQNPVQD